ncbi:uncharacterized protein LOC115215914 isoform X2 [Octopus sinensis]|uniref:Uncharacterized protein LOC115215914 isoform X2 n=1 Tax=Octopus sinensis TaxID=2607531 RepID=A0A7E6F351_9MOLL|nr:uncharacterized protein LOC115215914 isoform X2 [Octopus sinensis]
MLSSTRTTTAALTAVINQRGFPVDHHSDRYRAEDNDRNYHVAPRQIQIGLTGLTLVFINSIIGRPREIERWIEAISYQRAYCVYDPEKKNQD